MNYAMDDLKKASTNCHKHILYRFQPHLWQHFSKH